MNSAADTAVAACSVLLSALTFIAMQLAGRRKVRDAADARALDQLEQANVALRTARDECARLQDENLRLMRLLLRQDEDHQGGH